MRFCSNENGVWRKKAGARQTGAAVNPRAPVPETPNENSGSPRRHQLHDPLALGKRKSRFESHKGAVRRSESQIRGKRP